MPTHPDAHKLKLLFVEDLHAETETLLRELRDAEMSFTHEVVLNEAEFTEVLKTFDADVILSPYSLADTNAIRLMTIARDKGVDVPFILLAFDLSEDIAIDLLAEGVEDYILRSTVKRLPVAIRKSLQRYKTQLELRISEARFRQSEASLKKAQEIAKIGSWEWDLKSGAMKVSDELYRIYGIEPEELNMSRILEFVHEDDRDVIKEHLSLMESGDFVPSLEYRIITPDNKLKYVKADAKQLKGKDGNPIRLIGTLQDITEHKEIETQLINSKGLLSIGEQVANGGSFEINIDTGKVIWSDNLYELTGLQRSAKINYHSFISHVHPDDKEKYKDALFRSIETKKAVPLVFRFKRPDNGEIIFLQTNGKYLERNGGDGTWIGNVQDITDRVLTQTELFRSQASLEAAQRIAKIGSWEWNPNEKTVWWSEEMFRIYEIDHKEITLDDVKGFIHPDDKERVEEQTSKDLSGDINKVVEYRIVTGKGNIKHVISSAQQVRDADDKVLELIGTLQDVTEKVESELESNAEQIQRDLTLQAAEIGVWSWEIPTNKLVWDDRIYAMFGIKPSDVDIEDFNAFIHPEDKRYVEAQIEHALSAGNYHAEYRIIDSKGETKHLHARGITAYDNHGKPIRMDGVAIDMTERSKIEDALRESEQLFRDMAENVSEVFWLTDWQLNEVLYVSPQYEKLYGMSPEELYQNSTSWRKAIHPEDKERVTQRFRTKAISGNFDEEYRLKMKDGTVKWVRDRAFPVYDSDGNVSRVAGITEDITEKKSYQERVETLSMVASETINGVLIHGPDGKVEWANRGFERITGYRPSEVIGKEPWELVSAEETNQKLVEMTYKKISAGKAFTTENQLKHKSGNIIWVSVTYSPVLDDFGNVAKVVSIGTDITKEKELQQLQKSMLQRLEKANLELKRKAADRSKNQ